VKARLERGLRSIANAIEAQKLDKVTRRVLLKFFIDAGIGTDNRTQRRWIEDAVVAGLLTPDEKGIFTRGPNFSEFIDKPASVSDTMVSSDEVVKT